MAQEYTIAKNKEALYLSKVEALVLRGFQETVVSTRGATVPKFTTKKSLTATVEVPNLIDTAEVIINGKGSFNLV